MNEKMGSWPAAGCGIVYGAVGDGRGSTEFAAKNKVFIYNPLKKGAVADPFKIL